MGKKIQDLLRKYREGTSTPTEKVIIDAWYDSLGQEEKQIDGVLENELGQRYWAQIVQRLEAEKIPEERTLKPAILGIAAVFLCLIVAFLYFLRPTDEPRQLVAQELTPAVELRKIANEKNTIEVIDLPDGSQVKLHPRSSISYNDNFLDGRQVYLEGQAFFNVHRDTSRPFFVYTGKVITRVLGTSFAIKAFAADKDVTVEVTSGSVSVSAPSHRGNDTDSKENILKPNQKVVYNKDENTIAVSLVKEPKPVPLAQPLKSIHFDDASVSEIFKALETYYGVTILFDEVAFRNCVLTTSLSEESIYKRLEIICKALGATYDTQGTDIVITGKGCLPSL